MTDFALTYSFLWSCRLSYITWQLFCKIKNFLSGGVKSSQIAIDRGLIFKRSISQRWIELRISKGGAEILLVDKQGVQIPMGCTLVHFKPKTALNVENWLFHNLFLLFSREVYEKVIGKPVLFWWISYFFIILWVVKVANQVL